MNLWVCVCVLASVGWGVCVYLYGTACVHASGDGFVCVRPLKKIIYFVNVFY